MNFNHNQNPAGVDEAGRGPLAGPVVAACVLLPYDFKNNLIKDSKTLSYNKRFELAAIIKQNALKYSVIAVGNRRIDKINILQATRLAMKLCIERVNPSKVYIDGNMVLDISIPQESFIKGDTYITQISAASILAKTYRDLLMETLSKKYSVYMFDKHFGYPTKMHKELIKQHGISKIHRQTFRGVKEFIRL